jgi:hypothetical protein
MSKRRSKEEKAADLAWEPNPIHLCYSNFYLAIGRSDAHQMGYDALVNLPRTDKAIEFQISPLSLAEGSFSSPSSVRLSLSECRWHVTAWLSSNSAPSMHVITSTSGQHLDDEALAPATILLIAVSTPNQPMIAVMRQLMVYDEAQRPRHPLRDDQKYLKKSLPYSRSISCLGLSPIRYHSQVDSCHSPEPASTSIQLSRLTSLAFDLRQASHVRNRPPTLFWLL